MTVGATQQTNQPKARTKPSVKTLLTISQKSRGKRTKRMSRSKLNPKISLKSQVRMHMKNARTKLAKESEQREAWRRRAQSQSESKGA